MINERFLYRDKFVVKDAGEAIYYLENVVGDAESEGWDCNRDARGCYVCSKVDGDRIVMQRQICIEEIKD